MDSSTNATQQLRQHLITSSSSTPLTTWHLRQHLTTWHLRQHLTTWHLRQHLTTL